MTSTDNTKDASTVITFPLGKTVPQADNPETPPSFRRIWNEKSERSRKVRFGIRSLFVTGSILIYVILSGIISQRLSNIMLYGVDIIVISWISFEAWDSVALFLHQSRLEQTKG